MADRHEAPTCEEGHRRLHHLMAPSQETFPEACRCLAEDAEASLNHRKVPTRHRQSVHTSHLAERACEEERRRTKVIPIGGMKPVRCWPSGSLRRTDVQEPVNAVVTRAYGFSFVLPYLFYTFRSSF